MQTIAVAASVALAIAIVIVLPAMTIAPNSYPPPSQFLNANQYG
ncbi:MAG: hypothetical protein WBE34_13485 [Candidatus Nitrosopolaris sp.]